MRGHDDGCVVLMTRTERWQAVPSSRLVRDAEMRGGFCRLTQILHKTLATSWIRFARTSSGFDFDYTYVAWMMYSGPPRGFT